MIIVSQDKDMIINFNNMLDVHIDNLETNRKIYSLSNRAQYVLAEYKTKERAQEVLEGIIKKYKEGILICRIGENKYTHQENVYEMPEE